MLLHYLQLATFVAWGITAIILAPGTYRTFFGLMQVSDPAKSSMFFVALVFIFGSGRWLLAPDNQTAYAFVYLLAVASAVYVWVNVWNRRRDHPEDRGR